ncbi:DUF456 domain-containing protein [Actinobacillus capsulatus]|uniref:DUF456 domain-containing protein n=1 Tax=Actinobacillus capsulatus TaxID=717 RepID=UPI00036F6131|nr:DUF456 domain-containing protein [Actinobacillus capsulatus]
MKQNIIATLFNNQPQAFQAFSELKAYRQTAETALAQAILLKKENGVITRLDNYDFADETNNQALTGGLIGSVVGILGGPFGVLLGGSLGALFGSGLGATETLGEAGLLYSLTDKMQDGDTVILVLALEKEERTLDAFFGQYDTTIARFDVQAVQNTVAEKLKAEIDAHNIEKSAEQAQKAQERQAKFNEFKANVQAKLDDLAKKFKSE